MGKLDTAMCSFFQDRRKFADLFNGVLFEGREVIREEDLSPVSGRHASVQDGTRLPQTRERFRDVKMHLKTGETLRVLALENQNKVDYTLPYRCMEYDCMEYGEQLKEVKKRNKEKHTLHTSAEYLSGITREDRLAPVYTICLYHGEEPWDGPLSLRDMVDFGADEDKMSDFFSDYPLRLFCVNACKDFERFHTELQQVFTAMNCRRNKSMLKTVVTDNPAFMSLSEEAIRVLSVTLNMPGLWEERQKFMSYEKENEEEYDMCQAMRELLEDARNEGRDEGREEGREEGRQEARLELMGDSIRNLMETLKMTAEQAMNALKISEEEQKKIVSRL